MSIVTKMDMIMISTKLLLAILLKAVNHSRDSKGRSANNNSVRIAKTFDGADAIITMHVKII